MIGIHDGGNQIGEEACHMRQRQVGNYPKLSFWLIPLMVFVHRLFCECEVVMR